MLSLPVRGQTILCPPPPNKTRPVRPCRKLVVKEFLGSNMIEYSSFLISAEKMSYEEIAKNFENDGFFDCELGNATILALANIMRIGIVVFTSLEDYPVITIVPRNEPIACTTVYLAFEQLGAGHYDAVIESIVITEQTALAEGKPGLHDHRTQPATYDYSNAQISYKLINRRGVL